MALYGVGASDSMLHGELLEQIRACGRLEVHKTERLVLLESKEPTRKENGRWGLNFGGRGSGSSNKNMQLDCDDASGKPVLQMVKWREPESDDIRKAKPSTSHHKTYHVDFAAPCTLFQAFGFALAQLDL
jgi:hypothetical protein